MTYIKDIFNEKKTTLSGTIVNKGTGLTYAASRVNGTGLDVTSNFNATATNGDILIKNITGQDGLNFAGTVNSTNGQAEVYNKAGDLNVTSTATVSGNKAFILNDGLTAGGMTVAESATLGDSIMMVNKGSRHASVPTRYQNDPNHFREKLRN